MILFAIAIEKQPVRTPWLEPALSRTFTNRKAGAGGNEPG
jgi:hypothetical protein